jgi:chemotaxis protein MotB
MKKIIISIISIFVLSISILIINYILVERSQSEISQGKPIIQKDSIKQALLVIDIQEGITGKSSTDDFFIMKSNELINVVNYIISNGFVASERLSAVGYADTRPRVVNDSEQNRQLNRRLDIILTFPEK